MSADRIVVTVGTDHHRFDRLVAWTDHWAAAHPEVDVFIQHGTARAPEVATGTPLVAPDDLQARVAAATAVVTHGGLSSIMETRAASFLPMVLAGDPCAGEHLDGQPQVFSDHQERLGRIALIRTEDEFSAALDRAVLDPAAYRLPAGTADVSAAVDEVATLVDDLLRRRPARHRRKAAS